MRRWFGLGARAEELFDTFAKINELSDWCGEFGKLAQRFEDKRGRGREYPSPRRELFVGRGLLSHWPARHL